MDRYKENEIRNFKTFFLVGFIRGSGFSGQFFYLSGLEWSRIEANF
jgi:hypothetical protein